jgi:hypothetical protein
MIYLFTHLPFINAGQVEHILVMQSAHVAPNLGVQWHA